MKDLMINCDIQRLNDAVQQSFNICEIIQDLRDKLRKSNRVRMYDQLNPAEEWIFDSEEDFNEWLKQAFPFLDC